MIIKDVRDELKEVQTDQQELKKEPEVWSDSALGGPEPTWWPDQRSSIWRSGTSIGAEVPARARSCTARSEDIAKCDNVREMFGIYAGDADYLWTTPMEEWSGGKDQIERTVFSVDQDGQEHPA
jgi:hypothetical protein